MRDTKIGDVNVITNCGTVRRRILIAEDRNVPVLSQRDQQDIRNKMALRFVVLTNGCRRAGRIKISERNKLKSECVVVRLKNFLHDELGPSIGIGGTLWVLLVNRNLCWFSVRGASRR